MRETILSFLALLFLAGCTGLDEIPAPAEELCDLTAPEPEPDSLFVNAFEIQRVINSIDKCSGERLSRSAESYSTSTVCDSEGNDALYVVNCHNNGGFYIISARKDGCPLLAFNTEGNFDAADFKESDLSAWLETTAYQVTHMNTIAPDSAALNRERWAKFEKRVQSGFSSVVSRSVEPSELQRLTAIMMDKTVEWSMQPETEYYDYLAFRNRYPDKAAYYDEVLPGGMIYLPYYEDYEQLTMFVEYTKTTEFGNYYDIPGVLWSQAQSFAKSFPIWKYDGYGDPIYWAPGCTTIAAAQIMREYEWPEYLPWDKMPLKSASQEICDFLYNLVDVSNHEYKPNTGETGIFLEDMAKTLKSYDYKATYRDKFSENEIKIPCIVHSSYLRANENIEHAWNITRKYSWINEHVLEVWTFPTSDQFCCVDKISLSEAEYSPVYYYVNWGYGADSGNGWYCNIGNIAPPNCANITMRCMITEICPDV